MGILSSPPLARPLTGGRELPRARCLQVIVAKPVRCTKDLMSPDPTAIDPADGLLVDEVGPWAVEKHERLRRYISASRGARAKFLPPYKEGGASYIELFSGPGRSRIRGTTQIIDGSPIVAYKAAHASGARFSA